MQQQDGTILQSMERATRKVAMIELAVDGKRAKGDEKLTPKGQTQCRAALGSLQLLASQGWCWLSADINILAGYVPQATRAWSRISTR